MTSTTRGCFGGGYVPGTGQSDVIDYITMATAGNATDFGDLTTTVVKAGGSANSTRALFAGGFTASDVYSDVLDYFTIASTGNSTDFGDLTVARTD